jgi:hypothetical protein
LRHHPIPVFDERDDRTERSLPQPQYHQPGGATEQLVQSTALCSCTYVVDDQATSGPPDLLGRTTPCHLPITVLCGTALGRPTPDRSRYTHSSAPLFLSCTTMLSSLLHIRLAPGYLDEYHRSSISNGRLTVGPDAAFNNPGRRHDIPRRGESPFPIHPTLHYSAVPSMTPRLGPATQPCCYPIAWDR